MIVIVDVEIRSLQCCWTGSEKADGTSNAVVQGVDCERTKGLRWY